MKKIILFAFASLILKTSLAQIPTTGLIAYYPFCENANDASGNGYAGTVFGATLTADRFGNANSAYDFNGTSDYINLPPTPFAGLNVFSCSMWMRPTSNANTAYNAFCIGSSTGPYCWGINYNPPAIFAASYNNGGSPIQSYVNSAPISTINTWVHVVMTRDLSYVTLYVNGTMVQQAQTASTNSETVNYGTAPYRAVIGTRSNFATFFQGQLDDIRMYSNALTQNDVTALYNESAFSVTVNSGTICRGNSFTIAPTGGTSYTVSGGSTTVSPASTTDYTVTGSNNIGCQAIAISTVAVSLCTGIESFNQEDESFITYPNPSTGELFIQVNGGEGTHRNFILTDMQGRVWKVMELDLKTNLFKINAELPPGSYVGDLVIDGKSSAKKKIVIFAK